MKYHTYMAVLVSALSWQVWAQDDSTLAEESLDLPTGEVEYEMRLGAADLSCGIDFEYSDQFDQEPEVLDATVKFSKSSELSSSPDQHVVIQVQTQQKWFGLLDISNGTITFDTRRAIDTTKEKMLNEYGSAGLMLAVDRVVGEYVRGAIHGTIFTERHISIWMKKSALCKGEATFLMLPKS